MGRTYLVSGVVGGLSFGAFLGGLIGWVIGASFSPHLALPFAVCGAMSLSAAMVAKVIFVTKRKNHFPDEYASGFARTDEEVRQALADIEARKK